MPNQWDGTIVLDNGGKGFAYISTDASGNVTELAGPAGGAVQALPAYVNREDEAPYAAMQGAGQMLGSLSCDSQPFGRMHQFWEAIRRRSCNVVFLGDSVTENISQNWTAAHWTVEIQRELETAFPDVAFNFQNLSVGGHQALNVLGYKVGDLAPGTTVPTTTLGVTHLSVTSGADTVSNYLRTAASGATTPVNPDTWQGAATSETQWTSGEVWMNRLVKHNFDLMILGFGLNEENLVSESWFGAAMQAIISNVRSHSTWTGYKRPSIAVMTPYNDSLDTAKRDRLAQQAREVAWANNCPVIDANRWYDIQTLGHDPRRQRWYGEAIWRYLVTSKADNSIRADWATYWDASADSGYADPTNSGAASAYINAGGNKLKIIRKKAARDFQLNIPASAPASGAYADGVVSVWYRVDPDDYTVGYECRYEGAGTLTLFYHDGTNNYTITTKSVQAFTGNSHKITLIVRVVGGVHECWTAFGDAPPATGGDPASLQLQYRVRHHGGEPAAPLESGIFRADGYCGVELKTNGTAIGSLRAGNYITQSAVIQYGYPLIVNTPVHDTEDMQGAVSDHPMYTTDGSDMGNEDSRGGNTINHMATDAYSLVYAPAIGQFVRQLQASRMDVAVAGSGNEAVSVSATTSEEQLAAVLIPAGTLGRNGRIKVQALATVTGSTNNKQLQVKLGPELATSALFGTVSTASASNVSMVLTSSIANRNSDSSQICLPAQTINTSTVAAATRSIDTTVDNYVYFTGTKASAGETLTLVHYIVRVVGG